MNWLQFDVDKIISIQYTESYIDREYQWHPVRTEPRYRKFLGIKLWQDGINESPEGFYERESNFHWESYMDPSEFPLYGRFINGKEIWFLARVEITLINKTTISRRFETNKEALDWIEDLSVKSNKVFETITLNK